MKTIQNNHMVEHRKDCESPQSCFEIDVQKLLSEIDKNGSYIFKHGKIGVIVRRAPDGDIRYSGTEFEDKVLFHPGEEPISGILKFRMDGHVEVTLEEGDVSKTDVLRLSYQEVRDQLRNNLG